MKKKSDSFFKENKKDLITWFSFCCLHRWASVTSWIHKIKNDKTKGPYFLHSCYISVFYIFLYINEKKYHCKKLSRMNFKVYGPLFFHENMTYWYTIITGPFMFFHSSPQKYVSDFFIRGWRFEGHLIIR